MLNQWLDRQRSNDKNWSEFFAKLMGARLSG
jgi:hypothetical protein